MTAYNVPGWVEALQSPDPQHPEPSASRLLATSAHPHAASYRRVRAYFDTLPWRGTSAQSRLFAAGPPGLFVELFEPRLIVRYVPNLVPGFGHAVPAGGAYLRYLDGVVAAGFPEGTHPTAVLGQWRLGCPDHETRLRLRDALAQQDLPCRPCEDQVVISVYEPLARWEAARLAAEAVYGAWLLPPERVTRPAATDPLLTTAAPTAPLPAADHTPRARPRSRRERPNDVLSLF